MKTTKQQVTDAVYDVDYTLVAVKSLHGITTFEHTKKILEQSMNTASQLTHRLDDAKRNNPSVKSFRALMTSTPSDVELRPKEIK